MTSEEQATVSLDQKHTSHVAKIHYQKLHSQKIAKNAKELIARLANNSDGLQTLQNISNTPSTSNQPNETLNFENENCFSETLVASPEWNLCSVPKVQSKKPNPVKRSPKIPFSAMEDSFLKAGIEKYGQKWTKILNDPAFLFHSTRKTATLLTRAKTCQFI